MQARVEQIETEHDQTNRPEAFQLIEVDDVGSVEQQNEAESDEQKAAAGKFRVGLGIEEAGEFFGNNSEAAFPSGMESLERHIEDPDGDHDAEKRLHASPRSTGETDEDTEDDRVDQTLGVLPVVDGADTGYEAEKQGQRRMRTRVILGMRRRVGRGVGRSSFRFGRRRRWGGRVFGAVNRSHREVAALEAHRLAAFAAVGDGRCVGMICAGHGHFPF